METNLNYAIYYPLLGEVNPTKTFANIHYHSPHFN